MICLLLILFCFFVSTKALIEQGQINADKVFYPHPIQQSVLCHTDTLSFSQKEVSIIRASSTAATITKTKFNVAKSINWVIKPH